MSTKRQYQLRLADTQQMEMQLLLRCDCCGQSCSEKKGLDDRMQAVLFGAEEYAICPVCTQSPPPEIFHNPVYRSRCRREVVRLQALYELSKHG